MKELLKNKVVLAVSGAVILLLLVGGLFLLSSKKTASNQDTQTNALPTQIPIPTITADSIGLTLKAGVLGKTVVVAIANPEGITAIDYELSYTSKGNISRGAIGQLDVSKKPVTKEITLGTCSDVCHYDENVSNIKIILKITKTGGKVYQAESTLPSVNR